MEKYKVKKMYAWKQTMYAFFVPLGANYSFKPIYLFWNRFG